MKKTDQKPHRVFHVAAIVDGDGDSAAVTQLIPKLNSLGSGECSFFPCKPWLLARGRITKRNVVSDAITRTFLKRNHPDVILILYDLDDDCAREVKTLLDIEVQQARQSGVSADILICFARREWEAWFLGGIESLLGPDACYDGNPEEPRDAKGRFASLTRAKYSEARHQGDYTKRLDLSLAAQRCPSLQYLIDQFHKLSI